MEVGHLWGWGGGPQTLTTGYFPGSVARMQGLRGKPTCLQSSRHLGRLLGTQGRYLPKEDAECTSALQEEREIGFGGFFSLAGFLVSGSRIRPVERGRQINAARAYDWLAGTSCLSKQLSELWHISAD